MSLPPDSPLRRRLLVLRLAGSGLAVPVGGALAQGRKSPVPAEPDLPGKNGAPLELGDAEKLNEFLLEHSAARAKDVAARFLDEGLAVVGLEANEDLLEELGELVAHGLKEYH